MLRKILISILALFAIVSIGVFLIVPTGQIQHNTAGIIYLGNSVQLSVSTCPLLANSLSIESNHTEKNIANWSHNQHEESYNLLENIATLWREQEFIDDFMITGTVPPRMHANNFFWEIIPFPKTGLNFIDQLLVIWRVTFNSPCLSDKELQSIKKRYKEYLTFISHSYQYIPEQTACPSHDAFCDPEVIAKQLLYQGKLMRVLFNYAPLGIGQEKLHFMIIPIAHRTGFPELTLDEYLEAQEIASKLIIYFAKKGFPIVYLIHKTGKFAGQTVPHWHEHVIFAPLEAERFFGKLDILLKMLSHRKPLAPAEVNMFVNKYKKEVQEALKKD